MTEPATTAKNHSRKEVWKMFDRIAHRYDLLNRMLSLGQDVVWRKKVARHLPEQPELHVLDVATGTGDLIIFMQQANAAVKSGIGIDMAEKMLEYGRPKLEKAGISDRFSLKTGNAVAIPFSDNQFDATTISFGIRNVIDVPKALSEMHRVLKKNGRALILEFSLPNNALLRGLYLFYFRNILPRIGGLISGDSFAYRYLNDTVESFPYGEEFCSLMRDAGFQDVKMAPLTFGIATIYQGDK
ncbi:MAG: bifunctional demethylmenaquinone methyltransferase/2-methoxy-6-polyprenyl-1,4-benzoquinol methylase UbiE [Calditrichae bacterium]|nr:bifunctional demethylmenaquinone methyltransferase/2-methoxy-6-polyprenyl-1,4-benzoquinol methylase UbiE [Calditrichia bacterium]